MSVSDNMRSAVAARSIADIRDCLWSAILVDKTMTGRFAESLDYVLSNGISKQELYEADNGETFDATVSDANFDKLVGLLNVNFSEKKLEALRQIGQALYCQNTPAPIGGAWTSAHGTSTGISSEENHGSLTGRSWSVSANLQNAVFQRDISAVRDCLWSAIMIDRNMTGRFKESLDYVLSKGISYDELYQDDDGHPFDTSVSADSFNKILGLLATNFSKRKLQALERMGRELWPPKRARPTPKPAPPRPRPDIDDPNKRVRGTFFGKGLRGVGKIINDLFGHAADAVDTFFG